MPSGKLHHQMRLLELFSGTGSIGRAFEAPGLGSDEPGPGGRAHHQVRHPGLGPHQVSAGALPGRLGVPGQDVTYCSYGSPYRKRTRIWGTLPFVPRPQCFKGSRCESFRDGCHPTRAQRGSHCQQQLYAIPRELCEENRPVGKR